MPALLPKSDSVRRLRGGRQEPLPAEPVPAEPVPAEESQGRYGRQEPLPTLHALPSVHRHASFVLQDDEEEEEEEGGGLR